MITSVGAPSFGLCFATDVNTFSLSMVNSLLGEPHSLSFLSFLLIMRYEPYELFTPHTPNKKKTNKNPPPPPKKTNKPTKTFRKDWESLWRSESHFSVTQHSGSSLCWFSSLFPMIKSVFCIFQSPAVCFWSVFHVVVILKMLCQDMGQVVNIVV